MIKRIPIQLQLKKQSRAYLGELLIVVLLTAIALYLSLRLWEADLTIPLQYNIKETHFPWSNFDVSQFLAYFKTVIEGGWINRIDHLGAPGTLESYSFPFAFFPILMFGIAKFISIFVDGSLGKTINFLYLLSFFSASLFSFAVLRIYLSFSIALTLSILFAFIPYHFQTGIMFPEHGMNYGHIVPLSILIAIWLAQGDFFDCQITESATITRLKKRKVAIALLIASITAMSNTYYPFFSVLLWVTAGLLALFNQPRNLKIPSLWMTASLLVSTGTSLLLLVTPVIWHRLHHPSPVSAFVRNWRDSEFWGLKITQLYLPIQQHYLPLFANFAQKYGPYPYAHVNVSVALGLVGAIGFTSLIAAFFIEKLPLQRADLFKTLACLNLAAVLFATIAGYGTLFALAITPEIRALYRISPYISFFAFFAVGLLLQECFSRFSSFKLDSTKTVLNRILILGIITILGVADQTGYLAIPQYSDIKQTYSAHSIFFRDLEAQLPTNAMVFQLPYEQYPEGGKLNYENRWMANESFIPYLHTKTLRWSFGAISGLAIAEWAKKTAALPPQEMTRELCNAKFAAILLDKEQFPTQQQAQILSDTLTKESRLIFEAKDGRYAAFRVCPSNQ
jgi:phosphoglycerol transferase